MLAQLNYLGKKETRVSGKLHSVPNGLVLGLGSTLHINCLHQGKGHPYVIAVLICAGPRKPPSICPVLICTYSSINKVLICAWHGSIHS